MTCRFNHSGRSAGTSRLHWGHRKRSRQQWRETGRYMAENKSALQSNSWSLILPSWSRYFALACWHMASYLNIIQSLGHRQRGFAQGCQSYWERWLFFLQGPKSSFIAAHIRMRSCGPLEAHRLSLSLQASIPEKEQRRASTLAGPLEENFLSTAIPARGLRLPNLPARGQYDQRVSQAHTYDRYENEHSKSIAEGSSSTRDEASHSFSTLPDDSSYCSSPQFVYSSAGSLFTPSSVSGTTAVSSSRDDLIPAVWSPSFSNQQISSRSPKVSRYLPQLRAELIGNDIPSPTPAQKSPDDDAWKEFKQSLLGSDWMHGRRSSFAQTSQQHQPEYSDTDVQQRQTGELDLNASFDRTDLGQSSSEVLNFSGCSPALSSVYDSDMVSRSKMWSENNKAYTLQQYCRFS